MFDDICTAFTGDLRRLLIVLFQEAGTPAGIEPAEAAACIALILGLESDDGERLLEPATRSLLAGLLGSPLPAPRTATAPRLTAGRESPIPA